MQEAEVGPGLRAAVFGAEVASEHEFAAYYHKKCCTYTIFQAIIIQDQPERIKRRTLHNTKI